MFFYPLGNAICCFYCRWVFWHFVRFFYYWTLLFLLPRIAFLFFSFAFFITAAAFLMALHSVFRSHGFSSSMLLRCFVRFIIVIPLFFSRTAFFITQNFSFISLRCCFFIAATPLLVSLRCLKRDAETYNHYSRKSEKSTLHAYFWKRRKDTFPRQLRCYKRISKSLCPETGADCFFQPSKRMYFSSWPILRPLNCLIRRKWNP